jgi:hypothetical protein
MAVADAFRRRKTCPPLRADSSNVSVIKPVYQRLNILIVAGMSRFARVERKYFSHRATTEPLSGAGAIPNDQALEG